MAQLKCMPLSPVLQNFHLLRSSTKNKSLCFSASSTNLENAFVPPNLNSDQKKPKTIAGVDQSLLLDPWLLADANSRFAEYNGVQVHYKISNPSLEGGSNYPAILLHGFGASVFSWERVLQPLSRVLSAAAVAFDRPGFGLTSRIVPSAASENPYTLEFSASIALSFINFLNAEKGILIGHSAGCIVAADAYFKAPEKVAAMVLIAPAIAAPLMIRKERREAMKTNQDEEQQPSSGTNPVVKFISRLLLRLQFVALAICSRLVNFTRKLREILVAFYCKLVTAALRSKLAIWMVRVIMDRYGEKVVRNAWYNPELADKTVIRGYTKPLGCRNWDTALLEYVIALVAKRDKGQGVNDKLSSITCPVLIISGDTDRLVPAWNAKRLARVFPCSSFRMIRECGHLPQEEKPEEVLKIIREFVDANISSSSVHK